MCDKEFQLSQKSYTNLCKNGSRWEKFVFYMKRRDGYDEKMLKKMNSLMKIGD